MWIFASLILLYSRSAVDFSHNDDGIQDTHMFFTFTRDINEHSTHC